MSAPHLTNARAPLTREVETVDEHGERGTTSIPAERPLTVYVDRRELVTLMTLGAHPEWLVLGWLRNQRLVRSLEEVEAVTVDWDVGAAAVKTRRGIAKLKEKTSRRVVTTGCGQGSVFGGLMDEIESIRLPEASITQSQLYGLLNAIRLQESTYKSAGSVHGCALFQGEKMLLFVEDVGRHNAIDTIAGWMWLENPAMPTHDKVFYTTGRLTSEMVIKGAQMSIPFLLSRSGTTQMGHSVASRLGMTLLARCTGRHFLLLTSAERLIPEPELAAIPLDKEN
jgi:FdhD protein